jgi:hypothetical protein
VRSLQLPPLRHEHFKRVALVVDVPLLLRKQGIDSFVDEVHVAGGVSFNVFEEGFVDFFELQRKANLVN